MKENEMNIEKFLHKDAESIEIDEIFKRNLKKKIMAKQTKKHFYFKPYAKVASVLIAVSLFGGGINLVSKEDPKQFMAKNDIQLKVGQSEDKSGSNGLSNSPKAEPFNTAVLPTPNTGKEVASSVEQPKAPANDVAQNSEKKNMEADSKTVIPPKTEIPVNTAAAAQEKMQEQIASTNPASSEPSKDKDSSASEQRFIASIDEKDKTDKPAASNGEITSVNYVELEKASAIPADCTAAFVYNNKKLVPFVEIQSKFVPDQNENGAQTLTVEKQYATLGVAEEGTGKQYKVVELPLAKGNNQFEKVLWSRDGKYIYMIPKASNGVRAEIFKIAVKIK